jgi:hypothetical protein
LQEALEPLLPTFDRDLEKDLPADHGHRFGERTRDLGRHTVAHAREHHLDRQNVR